MNKSVDAGTAETPSAKSAAAAKAGPAGLIDPFIYALLFIGCLSYLDHIV